MRHHDERFRFVSRQLLLACVLMVLGTSNALSEKRRKRANKRVSVAATSVDSDFDQIGDRVNAYFKDGAAVTEGVVRVRRRHENDMDFSKYNPFYWEGRFTRFKVEDSLTGENNPQIKFTLFTEWPQDFKRENNATRLPNLSVIYTGKPLKDETERSKFDQNVMMCGIDDDGNKTRHCPPPGDEDFKVEGLRRFDYVLTAEHLRNRLQALGRLDHDASMKGTLLTFEFRFFNDEKFKPWAEQKKRNVHNLSAYYSEFFRIRIGEPGLYIDNFTDNENELNQLPSARRYSGGWATIPTARVEPWMALQQQAFNLSWQNGQEFLTGRTWFHTDFRTGQHVSNSSDDKPSRFFEQTEKARKDTSGSLYNVTSCIACHIRNAGSLLPGRDEIGQPIHTNIVRTLDPTTGDPHSQLGAQLQTSGDDREGNLVITRYDEASRVFLPDGELVILSKPDFEVEYATVPGVIPNLSPRRTPALIGMGLLNAVPDAQLIQFASLSKGRINYVGRRVGRFGWKASQPTLVDQIEDALYHDMGVLSVDDARTSLDSSKTHVVGRRLTRKAISELETYVSLLGVPPRNHPIDEAVQDGEDVFQQLNCHSCHRPTLKTGASRHKELSNQTIHPYTDLLLHDMGDGLADEGPGELARLWRTAPLWGLKNTRDAGDAHTAENCPTPPDGKFCPGDTTVTYKMTHEAVYKNRVQLLHDGRASSLAEAILWHGGEAEDSVRKYKALSKRDRKNLEAFLWDL